MEEFCRDWPSGIRIQKRFFSLAYNAEASGSVLCGGWWDHKAKRRFAPECGQKKKIKARVTTMAQLAGLLGKEKEFLRNCFAFMVPHQVNKARVHVVW